MVLLPVVVADHGRRAVGVADKQGADKHQYIHNDGDGRHAVLAYVLQHRQVEQQGGNAGHQGGGKLRHTVGGGVEQHPDPEHRLFKVEQAVFFPEHQEAHHSGDGVAQAGGDSRPLDTHVK